MRFFIALLLCLSIPLQGWAAGAVVQTPCPVGEAMAMAMQGADAGEVMADLSDCCNDAATAAATGKLCKTGQECQAPTGWVLPFSQPVVQSQSSSVLLVTVSFAPPGGAPASVWRPPTL